MAKAGRRFWVTPFCCACLEDIGSARQEAAVSLFVTVIHKRPEFQKMPTQQRIQEILSSLQSFHRTEEMDKPWGVFQWVVERRTEYAGAVEWAEWVLEYNEDVKGPVAKRRRR